MRVTFEVRSGVSQIGEVGGSEGNHDCDGELEDEVECCQNVFGSGGESFRGQTDKQGDADEESKSSSNYHE